MSSETGLLLNQRARDTAAAALGEPVEAATRCEHANFELACTSLPPIFLFAVTRNQVHVLRERHDGTHFVGAEVVRSWDRAGFQTKLLHEQGNRAMAMADNQRVFYLTLPPDAFGDPFHQQMASRFMSMGRSGTPVEFIVARDDSSQRVIDVMGTQVAQMITGTPQPAAPPPAERATADRLQVLESLRAGGAITEAEYTRKREQIIAEL